MTISIPPFLSYNLRVIRVETALSQKQISGLILVCFENERPLVGTLGYLDWRLSGHFSELLKSQVLTGKLGEFLYTPLKFNQDTYHFLVVGGGWLPEQDGRQVKAECFKTALSKVEQLGLENLGIVANDWELDVEKIKPELSARKIWILN